MKTRKYKRKKVFYSNPNKRILFIEIIFFMFLTFILGRLLVLSIFNKNYYTMLLNKSINDVNYEEESPRGRILDKYGKVIVDNKMIRKIYYIKTSNVSSKDEITMAKKLVNILDLSYDELLDINLKEYYLINNYDYVTSKITDKEWEDLKNRKLTNNDIYNLKIDRITEEELETLDESDRKSAYLYYLMNKGYSDSMKTIKFNATLEEYAYIVEHEEEFKGFKTKLDWERYYPYGETLKSILGSVGKIPREKATYYLNKGYTLDDRVGISGLEEYYDEYLKGEKAKYKLGKDKLIKIKEERQGNDLILGIDIELQQKVDEIVKYEVIETKKEAHTKYYNRSFVVIQNPKTGEIYAISGWHNYKDGNKYDAYDYGVGAILDAVTPGSIVKGASILVGYKEKVIDIGSKILDECISYNNMPEKCSWKTLGFINDLDALKWSSNIYMFKTAMMVGGQPYGTSKYLNLNLDAFDKYRSMFYQFGLGVKTGIDFPSEGEGVKGYSKDSDLLINYAIGQYDTYTPLEISQYITTIASNGKRIKPRFLSKVIDTDGNIIKNEAPTILNTIDIEDKYIKRVQEGFRLCIVSGTCYDFMGQKVKGAGKTGTSESFVDRGDGIYDHPTMSNNFIGYAPYNDPVMTLTVSSPDILDMETGTYRAEVNYRISKKVSNLFFTLYNEDGTRK